MSTTAQALTMFAAGIGIPLLAALNAALGRHLESPAAAAAILFAVALAIASVATLLTGPGLAGTGARLATAPAHLFLGGLFVAFYVPAVTWIAPTFGVGNAVFLVLLGQLLSAAAIDRFGLFGAPEQALTLTRLAGLGLMAAGVGLTRLG